MRSKVGKFSADGGPPSRVRYTNVHVKKDGQWLLSAVRDSPSTPPSNYEHLRGLDWVIGDWVGQTEKGALERISLLNYLQTVQHVPELRDFSAQRLGRPIRQGDYAAVGKAVDDAMAKLRHPANSDELRSLLGA
jgi:hypothetical protein